MRRKDRLALPENPDTAAKKDSAPATSGQPAGGTNPQQRITKNRGDNPLVYLHAVWQNREEIRLYGEEIDHDNPKVQKIEEALHNSRTTRRFWRQKFRPADTLEVSTDEELLYGAEHDKDQLELIKNLKTREEKILKIASLFGLVPVWYLTNADGEPAGDEKGKWIPADPKVKGTYAGDSAAAAASTGK